MLRALGERSRDRIERLYEQITTLRCECGFGHAEAMALTSAERLEWINARARIAERRSPEGKRSEW